MLLLTINEYFQSVCKTKHSSWKSHQR